MRHTRCPGPLQPIGGRHGREESPEDRTQARRPQEEAEEAPRSRCPLRSREAIVASGQRELEPARGRPHPLSRARFDRLRAGKEAGGARQFLGLRRRVSSASPGPVSRYRGPDGRAISSTAPASRWRASGRWMSQQRTLQKVSFRRPELQVDTEHR